MAMIFRLCHDRVKSVTKGYEVLPEHKIKKADKIDFLKQGKRGSNPR